jgi:hypothetical protein
MNNLQFLQRNIILKINFLLNKYSIVGQVLVLMKKLRAGLSTVVVEEVKEREEKAVL